jgi:hypothetical protein
MKVLSGELANSSLLPIRMGQLSELYNSAGVDVSYSDYTDEYIIKVMGALGVRMDYSFALVRLVTRSG